MMKSSASSTVSNLSAAAASHSQDPNYQRRAYHLMQRKMVGTLRFAHPTLLEKSGGQTPLGRAGQPAELGSIHVRLAAADAGFTTGQVYGSAGGSGQPSPASCITVAARNIWA